MYVVTAHGTLVGIQGADGLLQLENVKENEPNFLDLNIEGADCDICSGRLAGFRMVKGARGGVNFTKNGKYLCAEGDRVQIVANRDRALEWETFFLIPRGNVRPRLNLFQSPETEMARFRQRVLSLCNEQKPVKIHCGAGTVPRPGFPNLDVVVGAPAFAITDPDDYFIFPFADTRWDIPDDCVDYIFHEDFIEHITQLMQWQFLAETLRVMKPGGWHRVNTPNLITAMKRHSNFKEGFDGVYTGEKQWDHIAIFTPFSLKEVAETIGYREVVFTTRHHSVSPFAECDFRPQSDRDDIVGNIYADLLK